MNDILKVHGKFRGKEVLDKNRKHLEPSEIKKLFEEIKIRSNDFWYPFFYITYQFGCRVTETSIIMKEDVNLDDDGLSQIIIRRIKKRVKNDGDLGFVEMLYDIDDKLSDLVKTAISYSEKHNKSDNPYLFPAMRTKAASKISHLRDIRLRRVGNYHAISRSSAGKFFSSVCESVGISDNLSHPHTLRHTRATLMLASGMKPEEVQYFLGHENVKTTYRYLGMAASMRARFQKHVDLGMDLL